MTTITAPGEGNAPSAEQIAPNLVIRIREGDLGGAQKGLFGISVLALALSFVGMGTDKEQFFGSWLVAFMFTLSIALGAMIFVLIQHMTRAGWSIVVRRVAENMMGVVPVLALLIVPVIIGAQQHVLFHHWMHPDPADEVIAGKAAYLDPTFFYVRMVAYFVIWTAIAVFFRRASLRQDQSGDPAVTLRLSRAAAPCILVFAITVTFAAIDWIMSLDPHWFSTIFGVTYFAGGLMAFLGTLALVLLWLRGKGYLADAVNTEHYHDIGKLLFAFMVFWAYVCFSQYMLIWYANLPEETGFYQHRAHGSWADIGQLLVFGHFLVPFGFMMSRHIKRSRALLAVSALFLLVMHWLDMQFLIMPSLQHGGDHAGFHVHWLDATTMIGVFGLFLALSLRAIRNTPLVPLRDPRLAESLHFHNI